MNVSGRVCPTRQSKRNKLIENCVQKIEVKRLLQKVITARSDSSSSEFLRIVSCHHNDGQAVELRMVSQVLNYGETV